MIYPLLVVVVVTALLYWYKRWQKTPKEARKKFAKQSGLWALAVLVVALVLTGRAHWLMGVLATVLALAGRAAQLAQYIPMFNEFKKMLGMQDTNTDVPSSNQAMSRQQAAELLGVDIDASADEVRVAHKRLMQKIHPDRGGSDALAKQINHAKTTLLK